MIIEIAERSNVYRKEKDYMFRLKDDHALLQGKNGGYILQFHV